MSTSTNKTIKTINYEGLPVAQLVTPMEARNYEKTHNLQPCTQQMTTPRIDTRYSTRNRAPEQTNRSSHKCCVIL